VVVVFPIPFAISTPERNTNEQNKTKQNKTKQNKKKEIHFLLLKRRAKTLMGYYRELIG